MSNDASKPAARTRERTRAIQDSQPQNAGAGQSPRLDDNKDPKVGYKSPPKHTQFQPKQSGNPAGRPPGSKKLSSHIYEVLGERIDVLKEGRRISVTKGRALADLLVKDVIEKRDLGLLNLIMRAEEAGEHIEEDRVWEKIRTSLGPVFEIMDTDEFRTLYLHRVAQELGMTAAEFDREIPPSE